MDSLQIVRWCIFGVGIVGIILSISSVLFLLASVLCCLTLNMLPLKRKEINLNIDNAMPLSRHIPKKDDSNIPIIKHTISTYDLDRENYQEKKKDNDRIYDKRLYDNVIEDMQKEIQRNELMARKKRIEERLNTLKQQPQKKSRFLGE